MITFWVPGQPVGQPRQRVGVLHGHARTYTPRTLKNADGTRRINPIFPWKDAIANVASAHRKYKFTGPVAVSVQAFFRRPESHYGTGRNAGQLKANAPKYHTAKPDTDNTAKPILDVMKNLGFYIDDAQVFKLLVVKCYAIAGKEGAQVTIAPAVANVTDLHPNRGLFPIAERLGISPEKLAAATQPNYDAVKAEMTPEMRESFHDGSAGR